MSVLVRTLGYYSHKGGRTAGGLARVKAHLKYLEHGKMHPNPPVGFDGERDQVTRKEFMERLAAQPERGVIAHKLVFSLSQDERDRLGVDMRELVRETMAAYAAEQGRPLRWVGFLHHDPGHPHVHVVLAGYAGDGKQVGLYPKDLARLREAAHRERERLSRLGPVLDLQRVAERQQTPPRVGRERGERGPVLRQAQERVRHLVGREVGRPVLLKVWQRVRLGEQVRTRAKTRGDPWDRGR